MNAIDGIVWEADAQTFQFTFVSPQAERILGYPCSQWTDGAGLLEGPHPRGGPRPRRGLLRRQHGPDAGARVRVPHDRRGRARGVASRPGGGGGRGRPREDVARNHGGHHRAQDRGRSGPRVGVALPHAGRNRDRRHHHGRSSEPDPLRQRGGRTHVRLRPAGVDGHGADRADAGTLPARPPGCARALPGRGHPRHAVELPGADGPAPRRQRGVPGGGVQRNPDRGAAPVHGDSPGHQRAQARGGCTALFRAAVLDCLQREPDAVQHHSARRAVPSRQRAVPPHHRVLARGNHREDGVERWLVAKPRESDSS